MSYGGYNPYGGGGSGRGYGSDPFSDRNAAQYGGGYGGGGYGGQSHEMSSFSSPQQSYGNPYAQGLPSNPGPAGGSGQRSILDECTDIQNGIQDIENKLGQLSGLQRRALDDADMTSGSNTKRELDNLTQSIMDQYRQLTMRLKAVKQNPDARHPRNVAQVNKTDRDLRRAIQRFQEIEAGSRREMQARLERQARIVNPNATDEEIRQIVNSDTQVFQQAVLGSRTEQATRVLGAVKQRHQEMLQIERQLNELLDLMNDMQELLTKQEVQVQAIDTHAEQAAEDMVKANEELEVAVTTARKTRKKKWICLGICVLIIVIIVAAVVAYVMVNRAANGATKRKRSLMERSVLDDLQMNTARAVLSAEISSTLQSRGFAAGGGLLPNSEVEKLAKKRYVVWDGLDDTDN